MNIQEPPPRQLWALLRTPKQEHWVRLEASVIIKVTTIIKVSKIIIIKDSMIIKVMIIVYQSYDDDHW